MPKTLSIDTAEGIKEITLADGTDPVKAVQGLYDKGILKRKVSVPSESTMPAVAPTPSPSRGTPPDTDAIAKIGKGALGVGEHVLGGFAKTAADLPLQIGKLGTGLAMRTGQMFDRGGQPSEFTKSMRSATDIIEDAQAGVQRQIEGYMGAPDVSLELGPVKLGVGETLGSMLPFAAAGVLSAAKKGEVALSTVQTVIKSMKGAAGFSALYEAPNIIASHSGEEALQRAKQAGINIGVGTLMAGAFPAAGAGFKWAKEGLLGKPYEPPKTYAEVADRVFPEDVELNATGQVILEKGVPNTMDLGGEQPVVTPMDQAHGAAVNAEVKGKTARLRTNLPKIGVEIAEGPWNEKGEHIGYQREAAKPKPPVEPNLKITPGPEERFAPSAEEVARIKSEREGIDPTVSRSPRKGAEPVEELSPGEINDGGAQTAEAMRREYFKPGEVIEGRTGPHSQERVISYREGTPETKGRWTAVLEDLKTGKRSVTDRVPWDESALPSEATPPPPGAGAPGRAETKAPGGAGAETAPPPPPPGAPPFPPKSKVPALKMAGKAFEDATMALKRAKDIPYEAPDAAGVKELTDTILHNDKMTLALKWQRIREGAKDVVADIQGAVAPMSKLNGYAEKKPVFNFEGTKNYFQQILFPEMRKAGLEALPDLPARELVTLARDLRGSEKVYAKAGRARERIDAVLSGYSTLFDTLQKVGVEGDLFSPQAIRDNFMPRIYGFRASKVREFLAKNRPLDAANPHSFRRAFDDIEVAAQNGFKPATLDVVELAEAYGRSLIDTLANHQLVKDVVEKMPGRSMWATEAPRGSNWRPLDERVSAGKRETPVLDKNGKPTGEVITERLYADPVLHKLLSNVMDPSMLTQSPTMKMISKVNSSYKALMLALDVYHMVTITRQAAALWHGPTSWKQGIEYLATNSEKHPLIKELIANGLDLGHAPDWSKRDFIQNINRLETTSKVVSAVKGSLPGKAYGAFNELLWDKMHKGFKSLTAVAELQKYLNDPAMVEKYSRAELANKAAEFTNNAYGGQAWASHGRSQTFENVSRLILLAPDWFETRMNLAASALKKGPEGSSARGYWMGFLGQTMVTSMALNAIMAKVDPRLKDHPSVKGARGLINVAVPLYDSRGNPLILGLGGAYQYVYDFMNDAGKTLHNREAALLRAGLEFYTQRDWTDKRIAPTMMSKENWVHLGKNLIPWPLAVQFLDIEWSAAGVSNLKTKADAARSILRSMGTHPTSGYPQELRQQYNYLVDRRETVMQKIRKINENGTILGLGTANGMIREEARKYNEDVKALVEHCAKEYRGEEVGQKVEKLFITGGGK